MSQQNRAWRNPPDKIQQVGAVRVRRQIKIQQIAFMRDTTGARTEHKRLAGLCSFQPSARRVRIRIADKENGLPLVANHACREIMRGGVFAHHAGGEHKDPSAAQFHFFGLTFFEHDELQRLVQLQIHVLAVSPVRFEVVYLREHTPQPADINRLRFQFARAHQQRQQRQHFLCAAERERRNQQAALAFKRVMNCRHQPFNFIFA